MRGIAAVGAVCAVLLCGCARDHDLTVRNETAEDFIVVAVTGSSRQLLDTIQPAAAGVLTLDDTLCASDALEAIDPTMRTVSRISAPVCSTSTWTVGGR